MRSFNSNDQTKTTDLVQYAAKLSLNTSSTNIELLKNMINDRYKRLIQKYYSNETSTTIVTVSNQQFYNLPFDFSKNKSDTITSGNINWVPNEVLSIIDWNKLNVITNYTSDFPSNYFIYNGQLGFWPTPSTAGNTITYYYKRRVTDLSFSDYITGTVTATNASATITGSGTGFLANYLPVAGSVLNLNLFIKITPPNGDGNWYQISSIQSATSLTLVNTYQGGSTSGASFIIGQMPVLLEDFHDLIVFDTLRTYFSTIVDNPTKKKEFQEAFDEGIEKMDLYLGGKTVNVNLRGQINKINPNLYQKSIS